MKKLLILALAAFTFSVFVPETAEAATKSTGTVLVKSAPKKVKKAKKHKKHKKHAKKKTAGKKK